MADAQARDRRDGRAQEGAGAPGRAVARHARGLRRGRARGIFGQAARVARPGGLRRDRGLDTGGATSRAIRFRATSARSCPAARRRGCGRRRRCGTRGEAKAGLHAACRRATLGRRRHVQGHVPRQSGCRLAHALGLPRGHREPLDGGPLRLHVRARVEKGRERTQGQAPRSRPRPSRAQSDRRPERRGDADRARQATGSEPPLRVGAGRFRSARGRRHFRERLPHQGGSAGPEGVLALERELEQLEPARCRPSHVARRRPCGNQVRP